MERFRLYGMGHIQDIFQEAKIRSLRVTEKTYLKHYDLCGPG